MKLLTDLLNKLDSTYASSRIISESEKISFREFYVSVERKVAAWEKIGIDKKSIILLPSKRGVDFFIELFSCWVIGAIAVPLGDNMNKKSLLEALKAPSEILNSEDDFIYWDSDIFSAFPDADTILFTSGSSGIPKGVLHNHVNILNNCYATLEKIQLNQDDTLFFNIPFHFTSAICHFICGLESGANICAIEKKLFPKDFISTLNSHHVNCFGGSPIQLLWLANTGIEINSNFKFLMSSGDDLPSETIRSLLNKFSSTDLYVVYGLTEIGGRGCILSARENSAHIGSVGKPISGLEVRVINDAGVAATNEVGEVHYSGKYLLSSYIKQGLISDPQSSFGLPTGDIGYMNENGFLFLLGRKDDVFKVAGKKVSALVIRRAIMESGLVTDAAVVPSTADALTVPIAAVVLKSTYNFSEDKHALLKVLRGNLPNDHIPKDIIPFSKIPRTESGKVIRAELMDMIRSHYTNFSLE